MPRDLITGAALNIAATAVSGGTVGVLVVTVPLAAWAVVTTHHLLLIERPKGGRGIGAVIFAAPRQALTADLKSGLLTEIVVSDAVDGQSLLRLNLGVKRSRAKDVAAAIAG